MRLIMLTFSCKRSMGRRYKIPELGFDEALGPQIIEEGWKWDCAVVAFLPNLQQK